MAAWAYDRERRTSFPDVLCISGINKPQTLEEMLGLQIELEICDALNIALATCSGRPGLPVLDSPIPMAASSLRMPAIRDSRWDAKEDIHLTPTAGIAFRNQPLPGCIITVACNAKSENSPRGFHTDILRDSKICTYFSYGSGWICSLLTLHLDYHVTDVRGKHRKPYDTSLSKYSMIMKSNKGSDRPVGVQRAIVDEAELEGNVADLEFRLSDFHPGLPDDVQFSIPFKRLRQIQRNAIRIHEVQKHTGRIPGHMAQIQDPGRLPRIEHFEYDEWGSSRFPSPSGGESAESSPPSQGIESLV